MSIKFTTMEFFDVQTKHCYVLARLLPCFGVVFANGLNFIQNFRLIWCGVFFFFYQITYSLDFQEIIFKEYR